MNSSLKQSMEYIRRAELEFLSHASPAEKEEDIDAVKSELDAFRNLVRSHVRSRSRVRSRRADEALEAIRMQRVVEMLRSRHTEPRREAAAPVSGRNTLSEISAIVEETCGRAFI